MRGFRCSTGILSKPVYCRFCCLPTQSLPRLVRFKTGRCCLDYHRAHGHGTERQSCHCGRIERGIGRATALAFAAEGAHLALCARRQVELDRLRPMPGAALASRPIPRRSTSPIPRLCKRSWSQRTRALDAWTSACRMRAVLPPSRFSIPRWRTGSAPGS